MDLDVAMALTAVVLVLLYYYGTSSFSHWKDKGVKFIKPTLFVGSMGRVAIQREHMVDFFSRAYREVGGDPFVGYFEGRTPSLLVKDPEIIKNILVKDFSHFVDHTFTIDEKVNPLQAKNLFNMSGNRWKEMRAKLTPTFTSGRMKAMFPLVQECADRFEKHLGTLAEAGEEDLDIKELLARYTTDVIGSCAFGIKCDSINDPNDQFRVMGRKIFATDKLRAVKRALIMFLPQLAHALRITTFTAELNAFFRNLVRDVMALRKKTGISRKDFMQLLIELKDKGRLSPEEDDKDNNVKQQTETAPSTIKTLTDDDVTAQALVFFIAGFETSSSALTFALFELARRPELQDKARRQIEEVLQRHGGEVSYQALQEMTYLEWILHEALRKYPPLAALMRMCTKSYVIPGTKITIEEGTHLNIPIHAMQNDPLNFPDPERFEPERFSDENQNQSTQYVYMPFGEGPRQCIGLRFARMQSKLGLLAVLRRFEVHPSPSTKYPLTWDPRQFLLVSDEDVFIRISKVKN